MSTRDRILDQSLVMFASRGFEATPLDSLAGDLGITKQAILYHFGSKVALMEAVMAESIHRLGLALAPALAQPDRGWEKIEAVVRASFDVVAVQPELLGLLREVARLGDTWAGQATTLMQPLMTRASDFLANEVDAGRLQPHDSQILL
ncbi:MAG: TetR/AcrR family transcriptional regulator, partial [Acidimicrobiales bacterium]